VLEEAGHGDLGDACDTLRRILGLRREGLEVRATETLLAAGAEPSGDRGLAAGLRGSAGPPVCREMHRTPGAFCGRRKRGAGLERSMVTRIKRYFERRLAVDAHSTGGDEHALRLATAALLLETAGADDRVRPEEVARVRAEIAQHFELDAAEAQELMELADEERADSTDYFQFTSLIRRHYRPEQKARLIETLWRVAYADGVVHKYEEHLVRKIADLLYVSHAAFIAAKHKAGRGH
jgi:uncharacterized tellurite resistance protein B-like protein